MDIVQQIKDTRSKRKLSVPKLAKLLDIPADRIYKWEQGEGKPKHGDVEKIVAWIKMEEVPTVNEPDVMMYDKVKKTASVFEAKKPDPEGPDWKDYALKMEKLAQSWEHLADNQRIFIDQVREVSFNLNTLLSGIEGPASAKASELPAAAQKLKRSGNSGSFQTVHGQPDNSGTKGT